MPLLVKIVVWLMAAQVAVAAPQWAQAIFDEDSETSSEAPTKSPAAEDEAVEAAAEEKPATKKKAKKKRKKRTPRQQTAHEQAQRPDYSPENLARQSYNWIPESLPALKSVPAGLQRKIPPATAPLKEEAAPAAMERPVQKSIRWPQLPLAQVLIVAGFVLLFLIYRFRVARQPRRRRY